MGNYDKYIDLLEILIENTKVLKKAEIVEELKDIYNQMKCDDGSDVNIKDKPLMIENESELAKKELDYYKKGLKKIIDGMEKDKRYLEDKFYKLNINTYAEQIVSKLHILFNKTNTMMNSESEQNCSNIYYLESRYRVFINLVEWINDSGISLLVDRLLFCSFMHISVDAYEDLLHSSDEKIRSIFTSIETMYLSQKMVAGELGTRKDGAIRTNLSYDKYGSGLIPKDNAYAKNGNDNNAILNIADIMRKAKSLGYDESIDQHIVEIGVINNEPKKIKK